MSGGCQKWFSLLNQQDTQPKLNNDVLKHANKKIKKRKSKKEKENPASALSERLLDVWYKGFVSY